MASESPTRIVSLLPGATETVYALGAGANLVGVSHECDHPPAALKIPRVSRPRVDPHGTSREIDDAVKRAGSKKESLYELDAKLIARLRPQIILTQVQCEVCAVTPEDLKETLDLLDERPNVVAVDGQDLDGVLRDIRLIGDALGLHEEGKALLFRQWRLLKEIRAHVQGMKAPKAAIVDWIDPLMFAGNWIPELVKIAGGQDGLVLPGKPSRWGSWEELEEFDPEVLVVAACGRSVDQSRAELRTVLKSYRKGDLAALDHERVYVADGHNFFNRPGPRLAYTAALLAHAFHPSLPSLPPTLAAAIENWRR